MAQRMTLEELGAYLAGVQDEAAAVARELDEVQLQFVSAHETSKAAHDSTLADLSARLKADLEALPEDLRNAIAEQLVTERKALAERQQELAQKIVPEAEAFADDVLAKAQQETERIRALNPRLDQREEKLKAERAEMEGELGRLNDEIKRLSGCLAVFINFFKISGLDRRRQELLGRLKENATALKEVREEWNAARSEFADEERQFQEQWQRASVEAARVREELAQLRDDTRREDLALQRSIFHVLDGWKTPLPGPAESGTLQAEINRMVELNIRTDTYEQGLGEVAGLIALVNGIGQGLRSMTESVTALRAEQNMHSAYLSPITVEVEDRVIAFNDRWDRLREKVTDDKALAEDPAIFSAMFEEETKGPLAEQNITQMFEALGGALQTATSGWKG